MSRFLEDILIVAREEALKVYGDRTDRQMREMTEDQLQVALDCATTLYLNKIYPKLVSIDHLPNDMVEFGYRVALQLLLATLTAEEHRRKTCQ